jgi:hypothetical protein
MSLTAMWIHGNSVMVETPESFSSISRFGFGTDMFIKPGHSSWIHAAIPTPTVLRGKRPRLLRVIILYSNDSKTSLPTPAETFFMDLHLFDATKRIHTVSPQLLTGGIHLTQDQINTFTLPIPGLRLSFALGISMQWRHGTGGDTAPQRLFIAALGADFEIAD